MISRRSFLSGLATAGGVALSAPLLRAFANGSQPCRFVFVVEGNGIEPITFMTPAARSAIDAATTFDTTNRRWFPQFYRHTAPIVLQQDALATAPALSALASDGSTLDLVNRSSVVLGLSSKITGGGHSSNFGALTSTRSTPARPAGISIDALLASQSSIRGSATYDALRVGIHASDSNLGNSTCAYAVGRPAPIVMNPTLAFNNLFGSVAGPEGQAAFQRRGRLLDYALTDVNANLAQFAGSSDERAKLEQYLDSLSTLQNQHADLLSRQAQLGMVSPLEPTANPLYGSADPLDHLQAQFDLVEAALVGNLTNVAVIGSGVGSFDVAYPSLIADVTRHDLHHGSAAEPTYLAAIHAATGRHVDMVAKLARTLASHPEQGGTMLDNTVIVYLSDNGEQHHSLAEEWPILMVGGSNLGMLNDGRSTIFPGIRDSTNNRQLSNLFNTLGHAGGFALDDFGGEGVTRITHGPLSELRT